jgi:hypothetical protein
MSGELAELAETSQFVNIVKVHCPRILCKGYFTINYNETDLGDTKNCCACGNGICTKCYEDVSQVEQHSCDTYANSRLDMIYKAKQCKRCLGCKVWLTKEAGCPMVSCTICGTSMTFHNDDNKLPTKSRECTGCGGIYSRRNQSNTEFLNDIISNIYQ